MRHYLKTLTRFYEAVENGTKTFEVRLNDRHYSVGDTLILQEWTGVELTGREITKKITYILYDYQYCQKGYVIMAIK